ncbi:TPA: hypothetical protein PNO69_004506 [Salmonella enterica]|nr:hypothetical protein [Salmonella enterica]HCH9607949.1 hypothetical protein [Salmonella enterica]HDI5000243.1 hypothetical protein [Salmonella enterica]HDI5005064.1 hypothetical protein [Salmonella enterica]
MINKKQLIHDWSLLKVGDVFKSYHSGSIYIVTDVTEHYVQFKYQDNRVGYLFVIPLSTKDFDGFPFEKLN